MYNFQSRWVRVLEHPKDKTSIDSTLMDLGLIIPGNFKSRLVLSLPLARCSRTTQTWMLNPRIMNNVHKASWILSYNATWMYNQNRKRMWLAHNSSLYVGLCSCWDGPAVRPDLSYQEFRFFMTWVGLYVIPFLFFNVSILQVGFGTASWLFVLHRTVSDIYGARYTRMLWRLAYMIFRE